MTSDHSWLSANEHETISISANVPTASKQKVAVDAAMERMKSVIGRTKLFVTAGRRGAYLFNGKLDRFGTRPVENA